VVRTTATVDILSNGRLDLGFGLGYRREESAAFGVDRRQRGRRMDEGWSSCAAPGPRSGSRSAAASMRWRASP
jgi:hypothetical protein